MKHSLLKMLWHRIDEDDLPGLSAQMAYYFLLSMFPLLIFLFSLLPYLPIQHQDLLGVIKGFAPAEVLDLIEKNLHDIMNNRHGGLLSFSIIGTIWSSSNGISAVVKAFNKAYNVKETRSFFVSSGMSVLLTFGMILVFVIVIVIPIFGKEIGVYLFSKMGFKVQFLEFWAALRWLISAVMLFLLFTGLYWIAPNTRLRCRSAFAGAAFSTVGWIVSSVALSFYVDNFSTFSITYGSIGAIIVLMLWLYITAFIIVLGGEINAFYSERNKSNC
ncbi:MAG: YihY/virulence factor BrkB family protein [Bacillota bacterium]|nr:YihY/virulence factor BrkB family protein [Bacillota bacterium]MDP4157325.1 YihY/virulence factor BrkB family protein [Bacillota bacterium]